MAMMPGQTAGPGMSLDRFRVLNGSQARFFNLQLYHADSTGLAADLTKAGPPACSWELSEGFFQRPCC